MDSARTFVNAGGGAMAARLPGQPPFSWQRDFANALPLIMKSAVVNTEEAINAYYFDNEEARNKHLIELEFIMRFFVNWYQDALVDNRETLPQLHDLLKEAAAHAELGNVYNMFCKFFVTSLFAFMFGWQEMAMFSPATLDERCFTHHTFKMFLGELSPETRQAVVSDLKSKNVLPFTADYSPFMRKHESYVSRIKADIAKIYAKDAEHV